MRARDAALDLALLTEAALAAGPIALRYWKQSPQVWEKPGQGPVTEADFAVNAALRAHLRAARPAYGWLSEEDPDTIDRLSAERLFIIDPIDGTRAFIAGETSFALSLAVVEAGQAIAGVVYLPALDALYAADMHGPARKNGTLIAATARAEITGASVLTSKPNLAAAHWPGGVPDLKTSFRSSLAYRLCLVAEGRFDAMLTLRDSWEWDVAAGGLIASRAGAIVSDRRNSPPVYNAPHPQTAGIIAAGPSLHAALIAKLLA